MEKRRKESDKEMSSPAFRRMTYKGHEVLYPQDETKTKNFIDGRPVRWGKAGASFYLDVYAFDRGESLDDTVKRYLDYLNKVDGTRKKEGN